MHAHDHTEKCGSVLGLGQKWENLFLHEILMLSKTPILLLRYYPSG